MSFFGKKFRRASSENLEKLAEVLDAKDRVVFLLNSNAVFSFEGIDESTLKYTLVTGEKTMTTTFRLGEETKVERRDGGKVNVIYWLESDNVIKQKIDPGEGQILYFRREFTDEKCVMTISVEGSDVQAKIFYDRVH